MLGFFTFRVPVLWEWLWPQETPSSACIEALVSGSSSKPSLAFLGCRGARPSPARPRATPLLSAALYRQLGALQMRGRRGRPSAQSAGAGARPRPPATSFAIVRLRTGRRAEELLEWAGGGRSGPDSNCPELVRLRSGGARLPPARET